MRVFSSVLVAILLHVGVEGFTQPTTRKGLTRSAVRTEKVKGDWRLQQRFQSSSYRFGLQAETGSGEGKSKLPFFLDPGTKGGAVFLSLVLFIVPIIFYNIVVTFFGVDEIEAGKWIGIGFTILATLGWVSTYLFRVATKDMTYVS